MVAHTCGPSYSVVWGSRIAWTQEAEVAVSWLHHCRPALVTEPDSVSTKENKTKKQKWGFQQDGWIGTAAECSSQRERCRRWMTSTFPTKVPGSFQWDWLDSGHSQGGQGRVLPHLGNATGLRIGKFTCSALHFRYCASPMAFATYIPGEWHWARRHHKLPTQI